MMTTEEKLEEMYRREKVYKMGYDIGVRDMGICIAVVIMIMAVGWLLLSAIW